MDGLKRGRIDREAAGWAEGQGCLGPHAAEERRGREGMSTSGKTIHFNDFFIETSNARLQLTKPNYL